MRYRPLKKRGANRPPPVSERVKSLPYTEVELFNKKSNPLIFYTPLRRKFRCLLDANRFFSKSRHCNDIVLIGFNIILAIKLSENIISWFGLVNEAICRDVSPQQQHRRCTRTQAVARTRTYVALFITTIYYKIVLFDISCLIIISETFILSHEILINFMALQTKSLLFV